MMINGDVDIKPYDFPDITSIDIPESVNYFVAEYEYEPEIKGNRSGHPDTWTPDEPEYIGLTNFYWYDANNDASKPIAWHDLSTWDVYKIEQVILNKIKEHQ